MPLKIPRQLLSNNYLKNIYFWSNPNVNPKNWVAYKKENVYTTDYAVLFSLT